MADIIINSMYVIGGFAVAFISILFNVMILVTIKSKVPEVFPLLKSSLKKRPIVFLWDALNKVKLISPPVAGENQETNMYDMGRDAGVKIRPNPRCVSSTKDNRPVINYFTKGSTAITAKQTKALTDIREVMIAKGMLFNKETLDAVVEATDEDFEVLYSDRPEFIDQAKQVREELKGVFIKDGQFTFNVVAEMFLAAQGDTAQALEEYKSIVAATADLNAGNKGGMKDLLTILVIGFVIAIIGFVIYKLFAG